jgi:hypothetical protein
MFFSLKNISNTYTQIMNKFSIRDMLEDYLDDVIIKYEEDIDRRTHFEEVFKEVWRYIMMLGLEKCMFGVQTRKFLGYYLSKRGIEGNPKKN